MLIYPYEERGRMRNSARRLLSLAGEAKNAHERGLILPDATRQGIVTLTHTEDPSRQIDALAGLAEELNKRHRAKLLELAPNEFNAFCEYINPEEPPESKWHQWLTDELQSIEFDPALNRFILNCPPGHAKPLSVDTLVLMSDGSWKRLGDIHVGDMVVTHEGRARRVTAVHKQGELPVFKITTRYGREIIAAGDHSFRVMTADPTFKQTVELREGDPLQIIGRKDETRGRKAITHDTAVAELAAFYAALGGYTKHKKAGRTFQFWFFDRFHLIRVRELLDGLGLRYSVQPIRHKTLGDTLRLRVTDAAPYLDILRLDLKAGNRRVPHWLFKAPDAQVRTYLNTYFQIKAKPIAQARDAAVRISMKSEAFARDLQKLLARFEVSATVDPFCVPETDGMRTWLIVSGVHVETLLAAGISFQGWGETKFLQKRHSGVLGALVDEVYTVEAAGTAECRCLTVEEDHTFLADGVVVHNSTYASRQFVAWRLGRNPNLKVIGGGHTQRFVETQFSAKIRNLIRAPAFKQVFPGVVIDHATSAKDQWALAGYNGEYAAKGAGQAVHGFRANFVCVDDPYRTIEVAESPTEREKIETWFTGDLGSRMLPFGKMFLIMTRFHENDLTGYLEAMNPTLPEHDRWRIVVAPALCIDPETDVLGRNLGEVLWDYYDLAYFVTKKTEWKYQRFALVYQQIADAASESSIAGQFKYYKLLPHQTDEARKEAKAAGQVDDLGRGKPQLRDYFRRITLSVDCAAKVNERADWTIVQVWGETQNRHHYLIHQERKKVVFNDMISLIEKTAIKWDVDRILVEDKGQGTAYLQARGETQAQRRLAPAPLIAIDPGQQSKEFRFDEVCPLIEAGEVHLPERAEWIDGFVREVAQFPEGAHDDQVDGMTQYLRWAKGTRTKFGTKKIKKFG